MIDTSPECCAICGCQLTRKRDTYARPTIEGRSHATEHHYVAERFFGRSSNRRNEQRERIFDICPWSLEGRSAIYCYECHEELLHNPVFLPDDIRRLSDLVKARGLDEVSKPHDRSQLAGRIKLFQEVIHTGLTILAERNAPNKLG